MTKQGQETNKIDFRTLCADNKLDMWEENEVAQAKITQRVDMLVTLGFYTRTRLKGVHLQRDIDNKMNHAAQFIYYAKTDKGQTTQGTSSNSAYDFVENVDATEALKPPT